MTPMKERLAGLVRGTQRRPADGLPQPGERQVEADSEELFRDGVQVLHGCDDAAMDICFVHGLSGNRTGTWTARGQSEPWPKILLPPRLGPVRILTWGYDAYYTRKSVVAGQNGLADHAKNLLNDLTADRASCCASSRPLVFIAHSLGGLVCKEALLISKDSPEAHLRSIFASATAIAFMGTPHRGYWLADWADKPASALGIIKSTNKSLLQILQTSNQYLQSVQDRFISMLREQHLTGRDLEITCFFEELPSPRIGQVVSRTTATFEGYNSLSIHANHKDMVKFGSPEDNGFKRLLGELKRWEANAGKICCEVPSTIQLS